MSTEPTSPAPGWYPDPAGTPRRRYWDGRAWTEFFDGGSWDGSVQQPKLPEGTRVNTPYIWLIVLLPVLSLIALLFWNMDAYFQRALQSPRTAGFSQFADPGYLLVQGVNWLIYAAIVVLAVLDWRALKRIGIVRPFHWAWAFLPLVYIIGRAVVLRRRVHRGLAPLWTAIGVYVVSLVVGIVKVVTVFGALASTYSGGSGT